MYELDYYYHKISFMLDGKILLHLLCQATTKSIKISISPCAQQFSTDGWDHCFFFLLEKKRQMGSLVPTPVKQFLLFNPIFKLFLLLTPSILFLNLILLVTFVTWQDNTVTHGTSLAKWHFLLCHDPRVVAWPNNIITPFVVEWQDLITLWWLARQCCLTTSRVMTWPEGS